MYGIRSNGRALYLAEHAAEYKQMQREEFPVAKLIFVPKDSRGPRIISAEPLELQYMQQAMFKALTSHIERHSLTRGRVNFRDQSINGQLALSSSASGAYATIDLSDASDRLSCALFRRIWPKRLHSKFLALRSHATRLPNGEELPLKKFAPMGSAICFPVEALTFWSICVAALIHSGLPLYRAAQCCFVYGDDLIVPSEHYNIVVDALESVDLKVNRSKSFNSGFFRESCGVDAFNGHQITPVRIKKFPGRRPSDGTAHAAWLAYAGHLLDLGAERAGMYCRQVVIDVLGNIPFTSQPVSYLSVVTHSMPPTPPTGYGDTRWNAKLQRWEAKCWVLRDKRRPTTLSGWSRLLKGLIDPDPICSDEVVVKDATQMSRRWCDINAGLLEWILAGVT